jgi:hypothetical protein
MAITNEPVNYVAVTPVFCHTYTLIVYVLCDDLCKKIMITSAQKTYLSETLANAFDEFIFSLSLFNDEEINHIPFTNSWTPAQVATHIILATDGVPDRKITSANRQFDECLSKIRPWWEDLNKKFKSPEQLRPDDRLRFKHEILSELYRVREKDLEIVSEKDLTVICLDTELPTIGYLTRFEWLWFIEMHLRRHSFQLKNMRQVTV